MIFDILKYSFGSLFYGVGITVLFIALFIFLIKGWYKDAVFKPVSYVVLAVLSIIILWNSTIISGALAIKADISSVQTFIEGVLSSSGLDQNTTLNAAECNEVAEELIERHPILHHYVGYADFSGWTIAQLPTAICEELKNYLNGVILKKLLWSLGFVIVAAIVVIKTLDRAPSGRRSGSSSRSIPSRTSRLSNRAASRTTGRRRYSR